MTSFLSKLDESVRGCDQCPNREIKIDQAISCFQNTSGLIPYFPPLKCPYAGDKCNFNAHASARYLACDKKFAKAFHEGNDWLENFYADLQKTQLSRRKTIVNNYFKKIVNKLDFCCDEEDAVENYFFALNWDVKMKDGNSFLESVKKLILGKAIEYNALKGIN